MYLGRMGALGQVPFSEITLEQFEKMRAAAEAAYFANPGPGGAFYDSLMPVHNGGWFHDPSSGQWYRSNGPFYPAHETMPPVVAGAGEHRILTDAEAAQWIARVQASREPLYGSVLTIPTRMGWTQPWTIEEVEQWAGALQWPNEMMERFFASFPTRESAVAWMTQANQNPEMWNQKATELGRPAPYVPPSAAPPPPAPPAPISAPGPVITDTIDTPAPPGNVAPVGSTPTGHRYPILPYAEHPGTPMLIQSGWTPSEIGFWLANAFGGDLALTEAFLLSFAGREALAAWIDGKIPADVYARADAALAARRARSGGTAPSGTAPGGYEPPPTGEAPGVFGISLPMLALIGAGIYAFTRR